jgi:hypothetical protein
MALTNGKMKKTPDQYNLDAVKNIGAIINNGLLSHSEKMERLKELIDAVYVDGYNHGYGNMNADERESVALGSIVRGSTTQAHSRRYQPKGMEETCV